MFSRFGWQLTLSTISCIHSCIIYCVSAILASTADWLSLTRSSRPKVFLGKGVLKIYSNFTGEHPCRSVISINLLCNFIEITFWHRCSPVNLLHIFRTAFPKNTSGWLHLGLFQWIFKIISKRLLHRTREYLLLWLKRTKKKTFFRFVICSVTFLSYSLCCKVACMVKIKKKFYYNLIILIK